MTAHNDLSIRRARPGEAERVAALIDSVWRGSIRERRPYLFTPQRMADYLLCESAGELWGVVGAYPFDVRVHGITFRMAGIGQVITHPEHRGLGIMTALLERALSELRAQGTDAAWLLGDRLRYSRFGFVPGGRAVRFVTRPRYLPAAPPKGSVRAVDLARELDRIQQARAALPVSVLMPDDELALTLGGFGVSGWALGDSFALFSRSGDRMVLASGPPDDAALLLSHQASLNARVPDGPGEITFESPASPCPAADLGLLVQANASIVRCALFSVLALRPFVEKAAHLVPPGAGALRLENTDTGESATLSAPAGGAVSLTTLQLSEAFFDWLPGVPRPPALEPLDFHMTWFDSIIP